MKIKEACQYAELTDRAVRYYIEERLLSPAFTENYLGRRTFDFSEKDLVRLKEISVLRKFGVSIAEIRQIYEDPDSIEDVLQTVKMRKEKVVIEEKELLCALERIETERCDNVSDLVMLLSKPAESIPAPPADTEIPRSRVKRFLHSAAFFAVAWLPPFLSFVLLLWDYHEHYYPMFSVMSILLTVLSFWPTFLLLILNRLHFSDASKRQIKRWAIVFCIIHIIVSPILAGGIITRSETTDIQYYRKLEPGCLANKSPLYQGLFPAWPHYFENVQVGDTWETVYLDARYLYRDLPAWDYTYDIYAEWPLEEEDFYREVDRVRSVFSSAEADYRERGWTSYRYVTVEKGPYTCLFILNHGEPFQPVSNSYTYCIFAYNEQDLRVRYLFCDSLENGYDQPYYLELDWD